MSIKRLLKDVYEKVDYLNRNVDNPFLKENESANPFAKFFNRTYVWIEKPDEDTLNSSSRFEDG